jgi:hypothetical protein
MVVFAGRLTWVKLTHLQLFSHQENLPRIGYVSLDPGLVFISFPTRLDAPAICGEVPLRMGDMVFHSPGERLLYTSVRLGPAIGDPCDAT